MCACVCVICVCDVCVWQLPCMLCVLGEIRLFISVSHTQPPGNSSIPDHLSSQPHSPAKGSLCVCVCVFVCVCVCVCVGVYACPRMPV